MSLIQMNATNAGTESANRTVKTAARTAYGFRNLDNPTQASTVPLHPAPPSAEGHFPPKFEAPR
jgi:hypothetical protein